LFQQQNVRAGCREGVRVRAKRHQDINVGCIASNLRHDIAKHAIRRYNGEAVILGRAGAGLDGSRRQAHEENHHQSRYNKSGTHLQNS